MIKLVIFDLDGLLADTEKLHMKAYMNAFHSMGYNDLTEEIYAEHWIRLGKGIEDFLKEYNLKLNIEEIRKLKAKEYDKLVRSEVQPMPGAIDLLKELSINNIKMVLATASYLKSAMAVLETLRIEKYFQLIVTKENVIRNKPFPDIFLFAAEKMNVKPESCIVLEDAEKGIIAAHRAGMKSIAVPNKYTKNNDFSKANLKMISLESISHNFIDKLSF
jgi:HAD superfamily hydrolase (TIGR01509 family)